MNHALLFLLMSVLVTSTATPFLYAETSDCRGSLERLAPGIGHNEEMKQWAAGLVIPSFQVDSLPLPHVVTQLNAAIRTADPAAGDSVVKLNPNLATGRYLSLNFKEQSLLNTILWVSEVSNLPMIIRHDSIWIGAPPPPRRDPLSDAERARLADQLSTLPTEALIDLFADTSEQGLGSHATAWSSGFAAIDMKPRFTGGVLGSPPPVVSPVMREIVRRGVAALPGLIAHLDDDRDTAVILGGNGFLDAIWLGEEYDPRDRQNPESIGYEPKEWSFPANHLRFYVLKVGDLCYEAIGQIVNRRLLPARYQPTACLVINSPVTTPSLARFVRQDWGPCTEEDHRQSLIRDAWGRSLRDDPLAVARLCFYYPETGERIAAELLRRPLFDIQALAPFIQDHLFTENDPGRRRKRLDEFIRRNGAGAGRALPHYLHMLYVDSNLQQTDEDIHREQASQRILKDMFPGFAPDAPLQAATPGQQARLIEAIDFFPSDTIDQAVVQAALNALALSVEHPDGKTDLLNACRNRFPGFQAGPPRPPQ